MCPAISSLICLYGNYSGHVTSFGRYSQTCINSNPRHVNVSAKTLKKSNSRLSVFSNMRSSVVLEMVPNLTPKYRNDTDCTSEFHFQKQQIYQKVSRSVPAHARSQ